MMNDAAVRSDLFYAGIQPWAESVRRGEISFRQTIEHCLQLAVNEAALNAFECLDEKRALNSADALDQLLAAGTDLGPLMGVPFGVKDIIAVEGLPTTNGSNAPTSDLTGAEGALMQRLRAAGMITLGKTRSVEFALGATGMNSSRGTPWNPVDRDVQRIPGGSSSGSAVATASGQVGLALGTDTGGSIRIPACLTGIVGHKTSVGIWPLDGIFSLSTTLDSAGPLCRSVADAVLMHTLITGERVLDRGSVQGLRFGIIEAVFMEALDEQVREDFEAVCTLLEQHGACRVSLAFPEVHERVPLFTSIVPAELIATLGHERFQSIRDGMDEVTASRAAVGLEIPAYQYAAAQRRRQQLVRMAADTFAQVDVWLSPTCPFLPLPVSELSKTRGHERSLLASRNTQPGNLFSMCGLSLPMQRQGLPTGLQITMPQYRDAELLGIGLALERLLRSRLSS